MRLLTLLAALLVLAVASPAQAIDGSSLRIEHGAISVRIATPDVGDPVRPAEAMPIAIAVEAPAGARATVTIRMAGVIDPAGICRPVDAPDPEYRGWLVCGEQAGSWSATLYVATAMLPNPACQLDALTIPVSAAADGRRLGGGELQAFYLACYGLALPALRS